jgi:hypothetical protein
MPWTHETLRECAVGPLDLTREILATETPASNAERLHAWREKLAGWSLQQWWELTHPDDPALEIEHQLLGDPAELPSFLRRQAE